MTYIAAYPKRLIEVDLPIRQISTRARKEKSIRQGHISTLHLWWARRPLAACRAVMFASLWPDPADPRCPPPFLAEADATVRRLATHFLSTREGADDLVADLVKDLRGSSEAKRTAAQVELEQRRTIWKRFAITTPLDPLTVRSGLLAFIAWASGWEQSTLPTMLDAGRRLTQAAHEGLGGAPGTHPLVLDPFAGGGAMPLEALRAGADAFASDLNPVAVLLNRVTLEYAPKYREHLVDGVRRWGGWIGREALKRLAPFYPADADGSQPVIYLWARTVRCEGPACGAEVPLLRSLWLAKRGKKSIALRIVPNKKARSIEFEILTSARGDQVGRGTSKGGAATCPVCDYTTPVESIRSQLLERKGGASDARLIAVVTRSEGEARVYRAPTDADLSATRKAAKALARLPDLAPGVPARPDGEINHLRGFFNIVLYGNTVWGDLFSPRQLFALSTLSSLVRELPEAELAPGDPGLAEAIRTTLALIVNRVAVRCTANCIWDATTECIMQIFNQGQALPARWEFAEMCPALDEGSGWATSVDYAARVLEHLATLPASAMVQKASATAHPMADDSVDLVATDPPYYAAIPYADLSDFFFSWLRRSLLGHHPDLLSTSLVPKDQEIVSLAHRAAMYREKNNAWFEAQMGLACAEGRRVCVPHGLGVWVFANKETAAWEAMLGALIGAGWIVTASWPIDTESGNRLRAKDSAALASSIHLVCRPRENPDGTVREDDAGSWRSVLAELPVRIHEWMPRLAEEGVVGADAIFACLGPALEVFSQHSRVEKASGEIVTLSEYLEHVWAAVSKEALSLMFEGADSTGLEEDARLTAMWLWTLSTGANEDVEEGSNSEDDDESSSGAAPNGFPLEFDAARKIAQGLGAHLEELSDVVEVKSGKARLLSVEERTKYLFGKSAAKESESKGKAKASRKQLGLFAEIEAAEKEGLLGDAGIPKVGETTLDRLHQCMILFAAGRSDALKRFLVDEGTGRDSRFWKLAQSLSALYPAGSEEKRWVDGVLARKKSLGF